MAFAVVGGLLSVNSSIGSRRALNELKRLAAGIQAMRSRGIALRDLNTEWFRGKLRDSVKDAAVADDEWTRKRLRHVLLHGALRDSDPKRTDLFLDAARLLSDQDVECLRVMVACEKALDATNESERDERAAIRANWKRVVDKAYESVDVLTRFAFARPAGRDSVGTFTDRPPLTALGYEFLYWIEHDPTDVVDVA